MSHTPGELKVARDSDGLLAVLLPVVKDNTPANAVAFTVCHRTMQLSQAEANAKRIALTWNCHNDLLEALKALLWQAKDEWKIGDTYDGRDELVAECDAAIAKAEITT